MTKHIVNVRRFELDGMIGVDFTLVYRRERPDEVICGSAQCTQKFETPEAREEWIAKNEEVDLTTPGAQYAKAMLGMALPGMFKEGMGGNYRKFKK